MNLENKVIYQIYPKSFLDSNQDGIGDLEGIIQKLDYLQELGIDYLWLSPINSSPQNDNGYDISDYYKIDPLFGDNDIYVRLIKEANLRGIKIMMDLVLNHTSTEHEWFKKALNNDPYYKDFYYFTKETHPINSIFGGSAWQYVEALDEYYFCYFDKTQADLNWENPNVRNELYKMVNYWIDLGVEGFRLDVIDHISKDLASGVVAQGPKYIPFLKELNQNTFKDRLLTVGECWYASLDQMNAMCSKDGLFQSFHFEDVTITNTSDGKWFQKPLILEELVNVLDKWQNQYSGCPAIVMNNHDLPRLMSLWLDDQKDRYKSATLLITLFGLMRGNLYLYQGEEIGMTNAYFNDIEDYRDIETKNAYESLLQKESQAHVMERIKKVSRDNARTVMQWDDSLNAGFSQTHPWINVQSNYLDVNVHKDLTSEKSIYQYYKKIIAYRKANEQILSEKSEITTQDGLIMIKRESLLVVANMTNTQVVFENVKPVLYTNDLCIDGMLQSYQVVVIEN